MSSVDPGLHYPIDLNSLPRRWRVCYVGDAIPDIQPGFASGVHNRAGEGIPHLRPMNVDRQGRLDLSVVKYVANSNGPRLQRGDVLFNNTNSPELIGKTTSIETEEEFAFSNHMTRLRPPEGVYGRFVAHQLHFVWMSGYFKHRCVKHVNQASIASSTLAKSIPLILPPFEEQREIVAEIENQFTRLEAGIAGLRRVQANLKRYRAAVLKAACEGKLLPREGEWLYKPLSAAVRTLDQGWSPRCETVPSEDENTWAVIKTTAIQSLKFVSSENKRLPTSLKPRPQLELMAGDLLVTRAGPRSRVGVACLIKTTRPKLMLCDKAYRIRCHLDNLDPAFLEIVLNAPQFVDSINELKTGINDSGVNLTQKRFGELLIPFPSGLEQKRIVTEVERRLSVIEEIEAIVNANLQRANRLRQSTLQRAFTGERVS